MWCEQSTLKDITGTWYTLWVYCKDVEQNVHYCIPDDLYYITPWELGKRNFPLVSILAITE